MSGVAKRSGAKRNALRRSADLLRSSRMKSEGGRRKKREEPRMKRSNKLVESGRPPKLRQSALEKKLPLNRSVRERKI